MGHGGWGQEGNNMVAAVWMLNMGCDETQKATSHIGTASGVRGGAVR